MEIDTMSSSLALATASAWQSSINLTLQLFTSVAAIASSQLLWALLVTVGCAYASIVVYVIMSNTHIV